MALAPRLPKTTWPNKNHFGTPLKTLRYAIMLSGRKSVFRAGFRPKLNWERYKIGPPAGLKPLGPNKHCGIPLKGTMPDVTKPYKFIGFGAMDVTKPYKFAGFGAMDVTKPYKFAGFGAMVVTRPYKFIGFGATTRS